MRKGAKSHWRGHPIFWDGKAWYYWDTIVKVSEDKNRRCKRCMANNREDGHDPCLGELPGVANACCGHGVRSDSYVHFANGTLIKGFEIVD